MIPSIITPRSTIIPQTLSQSTFAPFGDVIENPLCQDINSIPSLLPSSTIPFRPANQNSALKASPISSIQNKYNESPSNRPSQPVMSMFACFPRTLETDAASKPVFRVRILERHPYTTQTFIPMGLSPDDVATKYLVIVAPTLPSKLGSAQKGPPDLGSLRAFLAHGRQAMTYGAGTWHAPMVVIGEKRIDFVVVQSVNGVPEDDCQEVEIEDGANATVALEQIAHARAAKL